MGSDRLFRRPQHKMSRALTGHVATTLPRPIDVLGIGWQLRKIKGKSATQVKSICTLSLLLRVKATSRIPIAIIIISTTSVAFCPVFSVAEIF